MNIPEDSDLICVSGPWNNNRVFKYPEIEADIRRSVDNANYPKTNEFKVLFPDGTWKRVTIKLDYNIKIQEILPEPLTTPPPPPPVFENPTEHEWPPSGTEVNY